MIKAQAIQTSQSGVMSKVAPAVFAMLLGTFMILGVGFASSATVHNAAHDTRHSFSFPCH